MSDLSGSSTEATRGGLRQRLAKFAVFASSRTAKGNPEASAAMLFALLARAENFRSAYVYLRRVQDKCHKNNMTFNDAAVSEIQTGIRHADDSLSNSILITHPPKTRDAFAYAAHILYLQHTQACYDVLVIHFKDELSRLYAAVEAKYPTSQNKEKLTMHTAMLAQCFTDIEQVRKEIRKARQFDIPYLAEVAIPTLKQSVSTLQWICRSIEAFIKEDARELHRFIDEVIAREHQSSAEESQYLGMTRKMNAEIRQEFSKNRRSNWFQVAASVSAILIGILLALLTSEKLNRVVTLTVCYAGSAKACEFIREVLPLMQAKDIN